MIRQWIPMLLGFGLLIILLIPDSTRLKPWFKDYINEFQYLIPPMNMIKFIKSDGETTSTGGRDKCSFFCHGFKHLFMHENMAIELNEAGVPHMVPIMSPSNPSDESDKSAVKKRKAATKPNIRDFFDNEAKESMVVDDDEEGCDLLDYMLDAPVRAPPTKRLASEIIPAVKEVINDFSNANDGLPAVNLDIMQGSIVFKGENSTGIIPIGSDTLEYLLGCYAERQIHIPNQSDDLGASEEKKDGDWFEPAVE